MKALATLALCVLSAACTDFTGTDVGDSVGVYSMASVNGRTLPFTLTANGTGSVEVTEGSVTLNSDRSFVDHTAFRVTTDSVSTMESQIIEGRFTRSGNTVSLSGYDGSAYLGRLNGGTLTIIRGSFEVAYNR